MNASSVGLAPSGVDALPLPTHLAGRWVNRTSETIFIKSPRSEPNVDFRQGKIEDWWPLLSPAQQRAIIMASIMDVDLLIILTNQVSVYRDGDVRVALTAEQVLNAPPRGGQ